MKVKSESPVAYNLDGDDDIIAKALAILEARMKKPQEVLGNPSSAKNYCLITQQHDGRERFRVLFLDTKLRLIKTETLSEGTLTQASVYPREVVRAALNNNAYAVVFTHNHPSGDTSPSQADINLTKHLKNALDLVDVRVIDHIITGTDALSMTEHGLI